MLGAFDSEEVTHVEGDVNPIRDIEIINEELRLKDEEYLGAQIEKAEKNLRSDKKSKPEYVNSSPVATASIWNLKKKLVIFSIEIGHLVQN